MCNTRIQKENINFDFFDTTLADFVFFKCVPLCEMLLKLLFIFLLPITVLTLFIITCGCGPLLIGCQYGGKYCLENLLLSSWF